MEAVFDGLVRAIAQKQRINITGFGSLEVVERPARIARNPQTGEKVRREATDAVRFRPGASLKAIVDGSKSLPAEGSAIAKAPRTPRPRV
ncbi:HU family DNA-binding protein [Streptomyces sp. NPDC053367]|uniref:HU family DNA-binding protein n=1 Tax=Streptomyces sp. NPDC053367 TaxID=3365700 RepID=UPI0037CF2D85